MTLRTALLARRLLTLLFACAFVASGLARAQTAPPTFRPEEIEALVAPIALYPDDLLSQVLMASTYPLEVVQAARWVKANPKVTGDAAVKAVADQTWDVSVKSLVAFPQVLEPMDQKLDWTQKLGDAFLADQKAVLDAVQRLRAKAQQAGNLKTTEQQKVTVEQAAQQQVIVIQPANPQTIYVPTYNPTVVYGGWGYPAYPPYYWPPPAYYYPGTALGAGIAFGLGVAAVGAIYGGVNWGGGDVNIDIDRATNIDRNYNRNNVNSGNKWQHNPQHRQGVTYRDNASREKYGNKVGGADGRADYRGRDGGYDGRGGQGNRAGDRPGGGDYGGANRPATADRGSYGDRGGGYNGGAGRDSGAFQGVGNNAATQRDYNRGASSNASMNANRGGSAGGASRPAAQPRPSGGAPRGGGGGGGGRRR